MMYKIKQRVKFTCFDDVKGLILISPFADAFSSAGIWSHLIFKWLNPLFRMGRDKKLELSDIPSIPHSETADKASSLLEESLSKHKTQYSSLSNAILHAIWRPLATNAIFAGSFFCLWV